MKKFGRPQSKRCNRHPPPEEVNEKDVRAAQELIGELFWVSTLTRPAGLCCFSLECHDQGHTQNISFAPTGD